MPRSRSNPQGYILRTGSAIPLWRADDGPVGIINTDPVNSVYISFDGIGIVSPQDTVVLNPNTAQGYSNEDIFAQAVSGNPLVYVVPNLTYYTPPLISPPTPNPVNQVDWIILSKPPYNCDFTGANPADSGFTAAMQKSAQTGRMMLADAGILAFNNPIAWLEFASLYCEIDATDAYDYGEVAGTTFICGPLFPSGQPLISQSAPGSAFVKGMEIYNLTIDGNGAPASVDHIVLSGHIESWVLDNVISTRSTGRGIILQTLSGQNPLTGRGRKVRARQSHGTGIGIFACTDSIFDDWAARGCGQDGASDGFVIGFAANSTFISPRSEFTSAGNNFNLNGNGGYTLVNPTTDRAFKSGIAITGAGPFTSTQPIHLVGPRCRRDASGGTGAGIAVVGAVTPVIIDSPDIHSGVNDDGSGSNTPPNGMTVQNAQAVTIKGPGYVQAAATPFNILGGNTFLSVDTENIITATGTNTGSIGAVGGPTLAQVWNQLSNANLTNGWTIGTTFKWRLTGHSIEFVAIDLVSPATPADGSKIINAGIIPGYAQPPVLRRFNVTSSSTAAESPAFEYEADGSMEVFGFSTTTGDRVDFVVRIPLD